MRIQSNRGVRRKTVSPLLLSIALFVTFVHADRIPILQEDFEIENGEVYDPKGHYVLIVDGHSWVMLDDTVLPSPATIIEINSGGEDFTSVQYGAEIPVVPDLFETPQTMARFSWLIEMTVRTSKTPYRTQVIVCNQVEPWAGTGVTLTIPERHEEEIIPYRLLLPPTDDLYTKTILFVMHLGGQGYVLLGFDDLAITALEALAHFSMEPGLGSVDTMTTNSGRISFTDSTAHRGVTSAEYIPAAASESGAQHEIDIDVDLDEIPGKNFRLSLAALCESAPYSFRVGLRDKANGLVQWAQEDAVLTEPDTWREFSWVIPNMETSNLEIVIQPQGQDSTRFFFDEVLLELTSEQPPTSVGSWDLH